MKTKTVDKKNSKMILKICGIQLEFLYLAWLIWAAEENKKKS